MAHFRLTCKITVSARTLVEADTLADAIGAAKQRSAHFWGHGIEVNEGWIVDEIDGEVADIAEDEDC